MQMDNNGVCKGAFLAGFKLIMGTKFSTFTYILLDIDECSDGNHNCSSHATCKNTPGGYDCECVTGYVGNGFMCESQ